MNDKVSIVIPVYNDEKHLRYAINSALEQTYQNKEIIVIDDGSTDSTPEIIKEYDDKIFSFHKTNGGIASALNYGITMMNGTWFKWLSSDDLLKPNYLETMMENVDINEPDKTIFYCSYNRINDSGKILSTLEEPDLNTKFLSYRNTVLLDHFYGNGSTTLIHKNFFDLCGLFDESLGFQEDYELWLRACLVFGCKLHLVKFNGLDYRIHENQMTEKLNLGESVKKSEEIREMVLSKLPDYLIDEYRKSLKHYKRSKPFRVRLRQFKHKMIYQLVRK